VNRRIDQFIRAKKKLIALLQEQKLVIVQQRVLGSSRTQPVLRPSGISGVGDIPADWDVIPTRYLFRPVTRRDITGTEPKMSMSRHLGLVRSDVLHASRAAQAATAVAFSVCHPGDLVMNKYQAHAGLFGAATERGLITANYSVFAPTKRAFTPYFALLYTCSAYRTIFRIASRGVGDGMMPLYTSAFHRVPSVVPPLPEQQEIVTTVERETAGIAAAIAIIERQLQQIGEYRNRLVADVVTGQLDVRAAAAQLPDLVPEEAAPEATDDDETDIDDGEAA
jgi:type I restriction enzyme, S subunit